MAPTELNSLAERTYRSVSGQVESMFELWSVYDYLKRNFDAARVLNAVAPAFFGTLHRSAFQGTIIVIRQLADPASSRVKKERRRNSSFLGLLAVTFGDDPSHVPEALQTQNKLFHALAEPICHVADKVVAHTDLAWGLDEEPFPDIPYFRYEDCVREARAFLTAFERHFELPSAHAGPSQLRTEATIVVERLKPPEIERV